MQEKEMSQLVAQMQLSQVDEFAAPTAPNEANQELTEQILKTLKSMERESKKQTAYMRVSAASTILTALLIVLAFVAAGFAYYKLQEGIEQATLRLEEFSEELPLEDIEALSESMSLMVENIDGLVTESRDGISAATESMMEVDIQALNEAIADLQSIIEPLADFFNMF